MKHYLALLLLIFFWLNCHAQHRIPIYSLSYQYENETKTYNSKAQPIKKGTIFIYDSTSNILYQCIIEKGGVRLPPTCISNRCWVALCTNREYYYTNTFFMDSMVINAQYWSFRIEESDNSIKLFGTYYFALSISPLEGGRIKYNDKYQYHRRGKKMIKKCKKKTQVIVY